MKAVLKDMFCSDIEDDLADFRPADPEEFRGNFQLLVGSDREGSGSESFQVIVCTPLWLYSQHSQIDIVMGRHYLFVFEYRYDRIIQWIRSYLDTCTGDTWQEVAQKVSRLGLWEFEDYQE